MTAQEIIDTVGKLGPLFVALAVFWATYTHNLWLRRAAVRAAEVEDQKLRLALLERRLSALEALQRAKLEFIAHGDITVEMIEGLNDALYSAGLVFDAPEERATHDLMDLVNRFQRTHRMIATAQRRDDGPEADKWITEQDHLMTELLVELPIVIHRLRSATRVLGVPPLTLR